MSSSSYNVNISYSSRRKSIALYVHRDSRVEVKAPKHCDHKIIHAFVERKSDWIQKKLALLAQRTQKHPQNYALGEVIYILGKPCYLTEATTVFTRFPELFNDRLLIPQNTPKETVEQVVQEWITLFSHEYMHQRLERCYEKVKEWNIPYPGLVLRRMKSRWGSCSTNGKITLNVALIHYPLECIDYVIYHELCHFLEFNHGPGFYRLLESVCPDWKAHKEILRSW